MQYPAMLYNTLQYKKIGLAWRPDLPRQWPLVRPWQRRIASKRIVRGRLKIAPDFWRLGNTGELNEAEFLLIFYIFSSVPFTQLTFS
jgi:hypothetical protein